MASIFDLKFSLPSVLFLTLGKEGLGQRKTLGKEFLNLRNSNVVFALQDDFKTKSYQLQSFITF